MRTVGAGHLASAQSGGTAFAWAAIVTRVDSTVYRWTSHSRDTLVGGNLYLSRPGIQVASLAMSSGFGVDNTECKIIADDEITRPDILAGRWDSASFTLALFDWKVPTDGLMIIMVGTLGDLRPRQGEFVTELRDLRQLLQQDTTDVVQPDCRYRLGDEKCTVGLSDFMVAGTVTSVTSRYVFTDTARTEVDDFFGAGEVQFTTGLNAGLRFLVRSYAADVFTLALPSPFGITIGDEYIAVAGCRKRAFEDCRDKFDNIINFGGEPDKARIDRLLGGR